MPAVPAHRIDDELRPAEVGLQEHALVAAAHEVLATKLVRKSGVDVGGAAADRDPVRSRARERLHHDRPLALAIGPGSRRSRRRCAGLLRGVQAMPADCLDHVEFVPARIEGLDPVGRQAHAVRNLLGEGHAPLGPGDHRIRPEFAKHRNGSVGVADIAEIAVVESRRERPRSRRWNSRGGLQMDAFDVAFQKLRQQVACRGITVDDDDAFLFGVAHVKRLHSSLPARLIRTVRRLGRRYRSKRRP